MAGSRRFVAVLGAVLAVLIVVSGGIYAKRPPRPVLPLPTGQKLIEVRGNCQTGNEVLGCGSAGPRSFLTVQVTGEERVATQRLLSALEDDGWAADAAGRTARDYADGGAAEDLQPVYCKPNKGCVGLFRYENGAVVLAWFS